MVRIERVHALEHTGPPLRPGTEASKRSRFRLHIHATEPAGSLRGTGEVDLPTTWQPSEQRAAWGVLTAACQELTGRDLGPWSPATAAANIVADDGQGGELARAAITAALADLLNQAQGEPAAEVAGDEVVLGHVRRHLWTPTPAPIRDPEGRTANVYDMARYQGLKVGEANQAIQEAAIARGLSTLRLGPKDFIAADTRGRSVAFSLSLSEASSPVPGVVTANKQLTRQFLRAAGTPVPPGRAFGFTESGDAVAYAESLGYPVVVKPLAGQGGAGVMTNIGDADAVHQAIDALATKQGGRGRFIVEEHVPGQDYRIYVAYGQVLSVVLRRPASITGDGQRTVAELVLAKNYLRRHNPHTRTRLIRADRTASQQLHRQGLAWDAVVRAGQTVLLASAANLSQGGDSTEVLPETHPSVLEAAVAAVQAIPGLNQAGVDFLLPDHTRALQDQPGGICEINTTPALMANNAVMFGEPQPVADRLFTLAAVDQGLQFTYPRDVVGLEVHAEGLPDPDRLRRWLVKHARRLGLAGRILNAEARALLCTLAGPTPRVAVLVAAMQSGPAVRRPDAVRTIPFSGDIPPDFEDVDDI